MNPSQVAAADRVLFVDSVGITFGARRVVSNASAWATAGRITVLLGRNGCGKTTLLKMVAGEVRADYGAVHLLGDVYRRPKLHRLARRGLFYLPDRGLLALTHTPREQLELFARRFGGDAAAVLERLNLTEAADVLPQYLSSGERRRAEVALAAMRAPTCLLADEPLHGIAPLDVELVVGALRRLAQGGCAVLMTGHEVDAMLALADDVIWMTAGTTHALGSPTEATRHHQFSKEYLGRIALTGVPPH